MRHLSPDQNADYARSCYDTEASEFLVGIFVYPFYLLFLVGPAQFYAEITELFRIGAKHPYVPGHIWEEIPWW